MRSLTMNLTLTMNQSYQVNGYSRYHGMSIRTVWAVKEN